VKICAGVARTASLNTGTGLVASKPGGFSAEARRRRGVGGGVRICHARDATAHGAARTARVVVPELLPALVSTAYSLTAPGHVEESVIGAKSISHPKEDAPDTIHCTTSTILHITKKIFFFKWTYFFFCIFYFFLDYNKQPLIFLGYDSVVLVV
jgi:hypothetical protein